MLGVGANLYVPSAQAASITVSDAGYWLETVGSNTIGIAGGGTPAGTVTTLFVATTDPGPTGGTTASANFAGTPTGGPGIDASGIWARRVLNPVAAQLAPLTVVFSNGADQAVFNGRSLAGLAAMPLVTNLRVDASVDPFRPVVSWDVPAQALAGDVDNIQLAFYNDDTNLQVGNFVYRPAGTTSFQFANPLTASFNFVINVRLVDLYDDGAAFTADNIQRESRAFVNYTTPAQQVPEPSSLLLMAAGLGLCGWAGKRNKPLQRNDEAVASI